MKMKKTLFTLITIFAILISSCGSDDENNGNGNNNQDYYIKARLNGVLTEYKLDAVATLNTGGNRISGYARQNANTPFPAFDFEITAPEGISTRSYSENDYEMIFRISQEGTTTYHSLHDSNITDFVIIISEITDDSVKGSFFGTVSLAQGAAGQNLSLTEGEFFLKRDLE